MNYFQRVLEVKISVIVLLGMLFLGILPSEALSQEIIHTYKITGPKRLFLTSLSSKERMVAYDPASPDHLFISEIVDEVVVDKSQFLFKGNKFNLRNLPHHDGSGELVRDGIQVLYNMDKSLASELIYKNGTLLQQTIFYSNGTKQMTFSGDQKALNGEFIMWHPNGKVSFLGNYKNNLKDGVFESFDESGKLERKGTYSGGKLITGESVVQDLVYDVPDVSAQLLMDEEAFNEYLKNKTEDLLVVNQVGAGIVKEFSFRLTIDKTGRLKKMNITSDFNPADTAIINAVLEGFPGFKPALLEGAPVRSIHHLTLFLTNKGLQTKVQRTDSKTQIWNDSIEGDVYTIVEEMPEFPGGQKALMNYVAQMIMYPIEAAEEGIQGKVFVGFVIMENGAVANVKIIRSVHPLLDAEAVKVIQNMPGWIPGRQNGEAVKVSYTCPIEFKLE